ncbi:MAG TPA: biotin-dependent carboxyltransferase family protein [Thiobacillaceae bacterium]|nr:biotin-dependent carboxyltransferase family protein [Thiobacillaceae bacterium]
MIEVLRAGLCDLVMDLGRPGLGALGVPAGGAADPAALAAANRLAGNADGAAALEILLVGPTLRFPRGGVAALTGARFKAQYSQGGNVPWNETLVIQAGGTLSVGQAEEGARCWLAVRGGITVPQVMGSCSTFLPGGFGGFAGRALRPGDLLEVGKAADAAPRRLAYPPALTAPTPLRLVAGPQAGCVDDRGLAALFHGTYHVMAASDRRGVRLEGPAVSHTCGELPSQGVVPGAVQVPADGQPIILGWDGPVTGGYPVVGTVIEADLGRVAQLRPGDAVRFSTLDVIAARALATREWRVGEME